MSQYLHGHAPSVLESHATRTAANSCAYLLPELVPGKRVLDIGCGPGSITLDFGELVGPQGLVIGVEPQDAVLATARAAAQAGSDHTTRFERADVFALPYDDASFDIVHAHQVLQHLSNPVAALREMRRVTAPGGVVAARDADYPAMSWWPLLPELDRWRELYLAAARAQHASPDAGRQLRAWANAAELGNVQITSSTWTYATTELTTWWGNSWHERALHSQFAEETQRLGLTDAAELQKIARAWRSWGEHPDAVFVMPHVELLARC